MRTVSIQIPISALAEAVAHEIAFTKGRNNRAVLLAARIGMPGVSEAIEALIAATEKLDNAQHTRGEAAAMNELFKAAKQLRMAVRYANTVKKEPKT